MQHQRTDRSRVPLIAAIAVAVSLAVALAWLAASAWGDERSRGAAREELPPSEPALRRPVALVLSADDAWLYVANRDQGTLAVLETASGALRGETPLGQRPSHLASVPGTRLLLATDEADHRLNVLRVEGARVELVQRLAVPPYPLRVAVADDGRTAYVSSLWSRQLTVVRLDPEAAGEPAAVERVIDLPVAPRELLLVPDQPRLIVADAFDGRLAVVDTLDERVLHTVSLPGHNIRGLAINPQTGMLAAAHQMLNPQAHTIRNDIHWGLLMSNDLRWMELDPLLSGALDEYYGVHSHALGEPGRAAGDPSALAIAADGRVVVALGGVGEVAVGGQRDFSLRRTGVGRRPVAVALASDGRTAYVANMFSDSVSVVDLEQRRSLDEIPLGPMRPLEPAERGEVLFFDAHRSMDGWMSCHSCHTDGHTNGGLNDNFSDGTFGAPKRVLSLLGRADTAPFAWNASAETLEDQIRRSLEETMQSHRRASPQHVAALAAFLETLPAPPPLDELRGRQDAAAVERGRALFERFSCADCHAPPRYTTPHTYDVGLEDELGQRHYNPPSLLGVGQAGPYLHDGRAPTLEDVFRQHRHMVPESLTADQLDDLTRFLRSL